MKIFKTIMSVLWVGGWWLLISIAIMSWCEDGAIHEWQPGRLQFYSHLLIAVLTPLFLAVGVGAVNRAINNAFLKAVAQQQK